MACRAFREKLTMRVGSICPDHLLEAESLIRLLRLPLRFAPFAYSDLQAWKGPPGGISDDLFVEMLMDVKSKPCVFCHLCQFACRRRLPPPSCSLGSAQSDDRSPTAHGGHATHAADHGGATGGLIVAVMLSHSIKTMTRLLKCPQSRSRPPRI